MKRKNKLILEFTEFNLQRFSNDSVQPAAYTEDPSLSKDAFDKHENSIMLAMSRIKDIMNNLKGTSAYSTLRSKLALEDQDIDSIKILKIVKDNNLKYDVYLSFDIGENNYWGKIEDILSREPKLSSEVFKDYNLYQPKEWVIKISGLVVKTIKEWLKPEQGLYRLLNDEIVCYSTKYGNQLVMNKGIEVELVRAYSDNILIKYDGEIYKLIGDNLIYFNWWFEKL